MKQFFTLVYGGLTAVAAGIFVSYLIISAWNVISPRLADGTATAMIKKTMTFNAAEEEDMILIAAHQELLKGEVTARAYLVRKLSNGTSIGASDVIEKDADRMMPIASITKLVTAIVASQKISPTAKVSVTRDVIGVYGNTAGFKVGETFLAGDLLYPLLMVSSNDAAEALARFYGRKAFIQAMNDFTQDIGAYRAYFADPSGLSASNVASAKDIAIILDWVMKNRPELLSITQLKSKTVRDHTWVNPTHFLSWTNYAGGKNGYTPEADRTSASLFTIGKNGSASTYAVILLGSKSRDSDGFKLLNKIGQ